MMMAATTAYTLLDVRRGRTSEYQQGGQHDHQHQRKELAPAHKNTSSLPLRFPQSNGTYPLEGSMEGNYTFTVEEGKLSQEESKKAFEAGNNLASDVEKHAPEDHADRLSCGYVGGYGVAKGIRKGVLEFHMHVWVRSAEGKTGNYCAVFKRSIRDVKRLNPRRVGTVNEPPCVQVDGPDGVQDLVSIDAGEFVENPEVVVPFSVRLQTLNNCAGCSSDIRDSDKPASAGRFPGSVVVGAEPIEEAFAGPKDRERGLAGGLTPFEVQNGELPGEMVEGRPHVLEAVSDQGTPGEWWMLPNMDPKDVLRTFCLSIRDNSVRVAFKESSVLAIERYEMFFCPRKL